MTVQPIDIWRTLKTAPRSNRNGNLRLALTPIETPASADHGSCITWNGPTTSLNQPGVVLRARITPNATKAILISQNVWMHARNILNVHLVDSTLKQPLEQIGGFNMTSALGALFTPEPLPWRICAQVKGRELAIKAWSTASTFDAPDWQDTRYVRRLELPPDAPTSGLPGIYVGHLSPGEEAQLSDLETEHLAHTDGNLRWEQSRQWAASLLDLTMASAPTSAPTAAQIDQFSHVVMDGGAKGAAQWASLISSSRQRAAQDVYRQFLDAEPPQREAISVGQSESVAASVFAPLRLPHEQWVALLYQRALHREPAPTELAWWTGQLRRGYPRELAVRHVFRSSESQRVQVHQAMQEVAARSPTSQETDYFSALFVQLGYDPPRLRARMHVEINAV